MTRWQEMVRFARWGRVLALGGSAIGLLACGETQNLGERSGGAGSVRECMGDVVLGFADAGAEADSGCTAAQDGLGSGTGAKVIFPDAGSDTVLGADGGGVGFVSPPDSGGGGGGTVSPSDCKDTCSSAAVLGCNLDGFVASDECLMLCANPVTESELDCVSNAPCAILLKGLAAETTFCGIAIHDEPLSTSECTNDCSDLVSACDPAFYVGSTCQDLCASTPTMQEMACLQTTSCSALTAALVAGASFCGFPAFADGGS